MFRIRKLLGFTQIEIFVIVLIIGIMAAIAAPSLSGMLEAARMKQAAVELRSAFQETQRQSIRKNQTCDATVFIPASLSRFAEVWGSCLSAGARYLPEGIGIATNVSPSSVSASSSQSFIRLRPHFSPLYRAGLSNPLCYFWPSQCEDSEEDDDDALPSKDIEASIMFGRLGSASFQVETSGGGSTSSEHSAKFVSFRPDKLQKKKSCVVLSRSLGLTRIGTYQGSLNPAEITSEGQCRVTSWTEQ